MKIEGKFILKVAGTLTAISLVVAALLGATNALTEDKIAAINKANTEVALAAVVSSPDCEFPPIEEIPQVIANEATTAGTGALDQFVGKSGAGSLVVKTNIDAVSGATVTTKGITKGANAALAAAEAMA